MTSTDRHIDIVTYIQKTGIPLRHLGSGEYGLRKADALYVLNALCENQTRPLGIELWRRKGDSYSLEGDLGWYSPSTASPEDCCTSAKSYINGGEVGNSDLVTIQFSGNPNSPE